MIKAPQSLRTELAAFEHKVQVHVNTALKYHATAQGSAAQMAVAAAMCGLELKALRKELGHGNWETWYDDNLEKHGLSLRTAQKYMALADGLKGKALKNEPGSFLALLESSPSTLTKANCVTLTKEVSKLAGGVAISELYEEFGIVKKPQGSGARGGAKNKAKIDPATAAQDAAKLAQEQTEYFLGLVETELVDRKFNAADAATRKKLHGSLVDLAAAVKATLK